MADNKIIIAKAAGVYAERHGITQMQALDIFEEIIVLLAAQQSVHLTASGECTQYDTGHPDPMFLHRESRTDGGK